MGPKRNAGQSPPPRVPGGASTPPKTRGCGGLCFCPEPAWGQRAEAGQSGVRPALATCGRHREHQPHGERAGQGPSHRTPRVCRPAVDGSGMTGASQSFIQAAGASFQTRSADGRVAWRSGLRRHNVPVSSAHRLPNGTRDLFLLQTMLPGCVLGGVDPAASGRRAARTHLTGDSRLCEVGNTLSQKTLCCS